MACIAAALPSRGEAQHGFDPLIDSVAASWQGASSLSRGDLLHLVDQSVALRDARILKATRDAALRVSNSSAARIAALRVLYTFAAQSVSADIPDRVTSVDAFAFGFASERDSVDGPQAVDASALVALASALQPLENDADPAIQVRAAIVVREIGESLTAPAEVTYVCGNKYRATNPNASSVMISYKVDGTSESGMVPLAPRPNGAAHSEGFFFTRNAGAVTVRTVGVRGASQSVSNGGTACTP